MADFYRLTFWLFLCALSAFAPGAFAVQMTPGQTTYTYTWTQPDPYVVRAGTSASAACSGFVGSGGPTTSSGVVTATSVSLSGNSCDITYDSSLGGCCGGIFSAGAVIGSSSPSCPVNSTDTGGSCVCNAGYVDSQDGLSCVVAPAVNLCSELAGKSAGYYTGPGGLGAKQFCETELSSGDPAAPNCRVTGTAEIAVGDPLEWGAQMTVTGEKCLPDPNGTTDASGGSNAPPPESPTTGSGTSCKPGQVSGTVNGQTVCVDSSKTDPVTTSGTKTNTETKPDGTTVETTQTEGVNCSPTQCTTTTTTTTTTTPPGGSPTTSTTTNSGTCSRGSVGCGPDGGGDGSSFGGSCGAAFSCEGDAIFCAVALEQHKRNCALFVDASPESQLYDSEKGKTGVQYTSESVALGSGSFSQSNALGGSAQCISDKVVTVWNQQLTLPFSQVCGTLQHLGTVLLFVSFLLAYRIVSRG